MDAPVRQKGTTLIEILVAVVLFAVSLAGMAALAISAVRSTADGQFVSQATILADELADTMRGNLAGYETSQFIAIPGAPEQACEPGDECSPQDQTRYDTHKWLAHVGEALPAGTAVLCMDSTPDDGQPDEPACDGAGMNTIKIFWRDSNAAGSLAEGEQFHRHAVAMVP